MPLEIQATENGAIYIISGWRMAWNVLFRGVRIRVVIEGLGPNPKITAGLDTKIRNVNGEIVQEGLARR